MKITIQTSEGFFACAEEEGRRPLNVTRKSGGPWETFELDSVGEKVTLKAVNGKYVRAVNGGGGPLVSDRSEANAHEQFLLEKHGQQYALRTSEGFYWCAEGGGGGQLLANREAVGGAWELFDIPEMVLDNPHVEDRKGLVRTSDRHQIMDNEGAFFPLGASLFWALWGWKNDTNRLLAHFEWLASHGFHYYRMLGEVGGSSWSDRVIDPRDADYKNNLSHMLDIGYRDYGLRAEITVFGGGTGADPDETVSKVLDAIDGQHDAVMNIELANEAFQNFTDRTKLRELVRWVRREFPGLVASSSWDVRDPGNHDLDIVNLMTAHTERQSGDADWRQVRQPWDYRDFPVPVSANEPPGPQSSVAVLESPLRLAMLRAVGIMCGMPAFVLHTGAGIRGGGQADASRGRSRNIWEVPHVEEIVHALHGVVQHLPVDLPNWTKVNGHWPNHPMPPDFIWPDGFPTGLVRTYGAMSGDRFVLMPFGVKREATLIARQRCEVEVFHPLTGDSLQRGTLQEHEAVKLGGDDGANAAYIVVGKKL